jgi:hypothetical protein
VHLLVCSGRWVIKMHGATVKISMLRLHIGILACVISRRYNVTVKCEVLCRIVSSSCLKSYYNLAERKKEPCLRVACIFEFVFIKTVHMKAKQSIPCKIRFMFLLPPLACIIFTELCYVMHLYSSTELSVLSDAWSSCRFLWLCLNNVAENNYMTCSGKLQQRHRVLCVFVS